MMTSKKPPRPPPGVAVSPRGRKMVDLLGGLSRIQGGHGAVQTPAGTFLDQSGTSIRIGRTTGGGITARSGSALGFGDVTDAFISTTAPTSATIGLATSTFVAFNFSSQPIGSTAAKYVVCMVLWGVWVVVSAEC